MTPLSSALREAVEKATPGPWLLGLAGNANVVTYDGDDVRAVATVLREADRALIVLLANNRALLAAALAVAEIVAAATAPRSVTLQTRVVQQPMLLKDNEPGELDAALSAYRSLKEASRAGSGKGG